MNATPEELKIIEDLMKAPYPVTLATIAKALKCTELEAARKMPAESVCMVSGSIDKRFEDLWATLASWEKVTLFVIHDGHVFEIQSKLFAGKRTQGYYNILAKDAVVGGHLSPEKIEEVAFCSFPFMGRESHSVQFFNAEGGVSFAVYVGRENHKLIESVREAFFAARETFCAG